MSALQKDASMNLQDVRVHLTQSWERRGWNIYIMSPRPGITTMWKWDGDKWVGTDHKEGSVALDEPTSNTKPYSLFMPDSLMEALVAAAIQKMPADGSMANHLKDAQEVRDRLLAMIEARGLR